MATLSYNETKDRQLKLRHIFLPSTYGFISEAVIGIVALVVFNVSTLSNQLISKNFDNADPLPVWNRLFKNALEGLQSHSGVQQVLLFLLWAFVGALLYILVFRILQIAFGVKHSVGTGLRFVRQDHSRGIFYWLASLHDFFVAAIIFIFGAGAILFGSVICFGIASQELRIGLTGTFPTSMEALFLSFAAAILSVRLITLGLSLLSSRFRNWYTT